MLSRISLTLLGVATLLISLVAVAGSASPALAGPCLYFVQRVQMFEDSACTILLEPSEGNYTLDESVAWLAGGTTITSSEAATTEGELLFEDLSTDAGFLCSVTYDGSVGASGSDEITKVLTLAGTEVSELDESGATGGLSCVSISKTCETGSELWPVNLPFKGQAVQTVEGEKFYNANLENGSKLLPAYYFLCLFLGASVDELCEARAESSGELGNGATDVELLGAQTLATCKGTAEEGLYENNSEDVALIKLTSGSSLSVSE
jgi:hypothetical protein